MKANRVLIIEDETNVAMLLADVVEGMGHGVCAIEATQAEAVAAAVQFHPDLMIVDARLGDGCGVTAVEEILREGFVPHLFVSGNTLEILARMPGALIIRKPFFEPELAVAIQSVLTATAPS